MPLIDINKLSPKVAAKYSIESNAFRNEKGQFVKGLIPWSKGKKLPPLSEEHKRKISPLGRKHSEKTKQKMRLNHKGMSGKHHSKETKKKYSELRKGNKCVLGKHWKLSEETRRKIGKSHSGEKSNFWKGGITLINRQIKNSIEYHLWREAVFARDNWTCQKCKIKGGRLHPHHICNFADYPKLRFAIDNGITFCEKDHRKFHQIYGKHKNNPEQLNEFLCQNYQQ